MGVAPKVMAVSGAPLHLKPGASAKRRPSSQSAAPSEAEYVSVQRWRPAEGRPYVTVSTCAVSPLWRMGSASAAHASACAVKTFPAPCVISQPTSVPVAPSGNVASTVTATAVWPAAKPERRSGPPDKTNSGSQTGAAGSTQRAAASVQTKGLSATPRRSDAVWTVSPSIGESGASEASLPKVRNGTAVFAQTNPGEA